MPGSSNSIRRRFDLRGQVQGVGFRPYVYRLAMTHALAGFVANNSNGAMIEVEGTATTLDAFERDLVGQLPPLARITELSRRELPPTGEIGFHIRTSEDDATRRPEVTPDAATCADCLRELFDPADRRYRYPFINCTNCGPRYSIIRSVPYDRPQTTMSVFPMCPPCAAEYADPADRRFHAQPNACPVCGPQLELVTKKEIKGGDASHHVPTFPPSHIPTPSGGTAVSAVSQAAQMLKAGAILAVKGIGGYHLACRADREDVVQRLRQRKLRDGKPLAVMAPDLATARRLCRLTPADDAALTSPAAPIVLAPQADGHGLAASIAPGCTDYGVMLPYAPLHHLLFAEGLGPLVMTSANLAGQPLTYRDEAALAELADVADAFLMHNREIFRPIDDSVVFTFRDEVVPIRRARGYAPRPIHLQLPLSAASSAPIQNPKSKIQNRILAVGGELKATVCLLAGGEAIVSEHLGDLSHPQAYRHFVEAIDRLKELCAFEPDAVACDLHPRYLSTTYAERLGLPIIRVQHHHAHIASVMAEWGETGSVVGLSCDGTGYGPDGAVWGCEVLLCERGNYRRLGHLDYFPLLGGDAAAIETWRPAAAMLHSAYGPAWPEKGDILLFPPAPDAPPVPKSRTSPLFEQALASHANAPPTSSLGRLFDAVSCLLGLCSRNRHEAEAAMALEAAASSQPAISEPLIYEVTELPEGLRLSAALTIRNIVELRERGQPVSRIAARFHETVARLLADAARLACERHKVRCVALSGGCFANRRLLHRLVDLLDAQDVRVLYHRHLPCGDGGLSLGQATAAMWRLAGDSASALSP